jgi:hypothetical protein
MKLFGIHTWKEIREVEEWQEVEKGARVLIRRFENPEEYHSRKKDMVTICFFGKLFTFKIPFR